MNFLQRNLFEKKNITKTPSRRLGRKKNDQKHKDKALQTHKGYVMAQEESDNALQSREGYVMIQEDIVKESFSALAERLDKLDGGFQIIPRRKITKLKWNGPLLEIEGYYYIEEVPLTDDDLTKKSLLLVNEKEEKIVIPLEDVPFTEIDINDEIDSMYMWAGFKGKVNLSTLTSKGLPLPNGVYNVFLKTEFTVEGEEEKCEKVIPLGNVKDMLKDGFYSTKIEYFSAKRELKYNLLVTYNIAEKTLTIKSTKLKDLNPANLLLEKSEKKGLFYKWFRSQAFKGIYNICKLFPLKQKNVLFASDSRIEMSGNFQFVYEEMLSRNLDLNYHFALKESIDEKKTYKEMVTLAYMMATSKFIILDDFYPMVYPLKIRKDAELIQLWHAVGAFKTFGYSRIGRPGGPSIKSKNHRNYTKAIVSSTNVRKYYAEGFGIPNENVIPTGIPRTDVFFDLEYQKEVKDRLYEKYPFLKNKKVITFAPTFRGNGQTSAHYPLEMLDMEKMYNQLKDEYVFILKLHPFVNNDFSIPYQYSDFFYDFSEYREINDILFVTDLLITDYSSVCFEFALLNRPMMFFAFDVEEYVAKRDFYYDYHSFIPGPLVRTTDEMLETIASGDFQTNKIEPFVKYYFEDLDGKSSARVVDQLILGVEEEGLEEDVSKFQERNFSIYKK